MITNQLGIIVMLENNSGPKYFFCYFMLCTFFDNKVINAYNYHLKVKVLVSLDV